MEERVKELENKVAKLESEINQLRKELKFYVDGIVAGIMKN
ncbi:hypothetical protein [Virgibacillus pantothenticus]|nr:hypothetical protein [Virgibacillus pantothenticus]MED3737260.1 hypothetical protein [Virgibacillus pantothenticus]